MEKHRDDNLFQPHCNSSDESLNNTQRILDTEGRYGYTPFRGKPPSHVPIEAYKKKEKEFRTVFLAQELRDPQSSIGGHQRERDAPYSIWAIDSSKDGRYLATAGSDQTVRVWKVLSTLENRANYSKERNAKEGGCAGLYAPVFHPHPHRQFKGHTKEIVDLSWSKNGFLLSCSMDRTVRLWHIQHDRCVWRITHTEPLTSITFHPQDDRFFLGGSLDGTLNIWSIPDKVIVYSAKVSDAITAVAFSPGGEKSIVGCLGGLCSFYKTEGLELEHQFVIEPTRTDTSKITGIQTTLSKHGAVEKHVKAIVTSADSCTRIFDIQTKSLETILEGHQVTSHQIRARPSDDGKFVICGSENKKVFIWPILARPPTWKGKEKMPYESFQAHSSAITQAMFLPTASNLLLQASFDPVFTACNPPPVILRSNNERKFSQELSPHDILTELLGHGHDSHMAAMFMERSRHPYGRIIITADTLGTIKVFRQNCTCLKHRGD